MDEVLNIKNLNVSFDSAYGTIPAVRGMTLSVAKGEILALVGESGCGKSVTAQSILKLNDTPGTRTTAEELTLCGRDILALSEKELLDVRGKLASMVFQDSLAYLNPTMKVGQQVTEALLHSGRKTAAECRKEAVRLLNLVRIPDANLRAEQYPHEFSGGMRQRAMIAMALACEPQLLIADEPTTALDPTIQLEILRLLKQMQRKLQTSILLITHDLSVVANVADRAAVMYAGKIVETGPVGSLFTNPSHPYTKGLLESLPSRDASRKLHVIPGAPPNTHALPPGCAFAPRCENRMALCIQEEPPALDVDPKHQASCWLLHPNCPKGGVF